MLKSRGLIALALSIFIGLIATRAVYQYLNKPDPVKKSVKAVTQKPQKSLTFSEKIPEGMRIVSIKLDRDSDMPVQLGRGDLVDVAVTSKIPEKDGGSITRIILECIEIYDPGKEEEDSSKKRSNRQEERYVSLLVSPEDAITIIAASESAKISLIARKKTDERGTGDLVAAYSYGMGVERLKEYHDSSSGMPLPGMRAITITARDTDGILGVLKPGDRVDIIITSLYSRFGSSGAITPGSEGTVTEYNLSSEILMQDVEVIATEKILDLSIGKEEPAQRVTLLVTPDQAVKLAVAMDATKKSVIRLVSRHPDDQGRPEIRHELSEILADKKVYHRVEVFKGGKEGSKSFFH